MAFQPPQRASLVPAVKNLLALAEDDRLTPGAPGLDEQNGFYVERVFHFAHQVSEYLDKIGGLDVNGNAIDAVANALNNARSQLEAYLSNGNVAHINNARAQIDGSAEPNFRDAIPLGVEVHPKTSASLELYRQRAKKAKDDLVRDTNTLQNEIEALRQSINEKQADLEALRNEIAEQRGSSGTLVEELRTQASNDREQFQARLEDLLSDAKSNIAVVTTELQSSSTDALKELSEKRDEASRVVQAVGDILTTGTYEDRASKETQKADYYRSITIGLFGFGLLIVVSNYLFYFVGWLVGHQPDIAEAWPMLAARLATAVAVALPAIYTARESARHRTNADTAKQRQLELMTLGPFIELLPDEKKAEIRDRLTDKYFGNRVDPHEIEVPIDLDKISKVAESLGKLKSLG